MNDFRQLELYHHGILGQKWGVRRYQNTDGSYTNLGKNRRRLEGGKPEDYASKSMAAKASNKVATSATAIVDRSSRRSRDKAQSRMDVSKMSNDDLQRAISRMNLEKQYKMLSTENLTPGRDRVSYILSTAGDVLAIAASAATVAMAISKIQNSRAQS